MANIQCYAWSVILGFIIVCGWDLSIFNLVQRYLNWGDNRIPLPLVIYSYKLGAGQATYMYIHICSKMKWFLGQASILLFLGGIFNIVLHTEPQLHWNLCVLVSVSKVSKAECQNQAARWIKQQNVNVILLAPLAIIDLSQNWWLETDDSRSPHSQVNMILQFCCFDIFLLSATALCSNHGLQNDLPTYAQIIDTMSSVFSFIL